MSSCSVAQDAERQRGCLESDQSSFSRPKPAAMPAHPADAGGTRICPVRVTAEQRVERLAGRWQVDFERASAAYHEAGHAVAGLWFGWTVGRHGIEIDEHQRCTFACSAYAYTTEARAVVAMAGWLAERKWHGQGSGNWDTQLVHILDAHAWGQVIVGDDEQQVVKALVGHREADDIETEEFLLAVHAFREHTIGLLARPPFWRAVRRVTRALLSHGKLSDVEVVNAIGKDDFLRVSHGHWTAGS